MKVSRGAVARALLAAGAVIVLAGVCNAEPAYLEHALSAQQRDASAVQPGLFPLVIRMAVSLCLVIALIVVCAFIFRRFMPVAAGSRNPLGRVLYSFNLNPKASLYVVDVAGQVLVLGCAGQGVQLLHHLTEPQSLKLVRDASAPGAASSPSVFTAIFGKHLSKYAPQTDINGLRASIERLKEKRDGS